MKLDPRLRKFISFGLIGSGALTVISGVVNIIGAYQLIDPADAESLGVSRNEFVYTYAGFVVVGVILIFFGFRCRKERPPASGSKP